MVCVKDNAKTVLRALIWNFVLILRCLRKDQIMIRTDCECRIIWIVWEIYYKGMFGHTEMSICWKESSGHDYRRGAWEGMTPQESRASWWDAMNISPGWVCAGGLCGASACGCRNSDLKTECWRRKNYMPRSSMWKPVRSWQALQPPGPGKPITTEKLRTARACATLSACADTYSDHMEEGGGCCIQPDKARGPGGLCWAPAWSPQSSAGPSISEQTTSTGLPVAAPAGQQGVIASTSLSACMYLYLLLIITTA